nr:glycosyltransferase family 9 protein [Brenneria tiliae]
MFFFKKVRHKKEINRILVIRIDFLGDMVCTTSLLRDLKKRWPDSELHVLANKYNAPILDDNPDVAKIHYYVYSKKYEKNINPGFLNAMLDKVKLIFTLRKINFDLLVIPNGGVNKNSVQFANLLNVRDARWHNEKTGFDDRNQSHIATRPMKHEVLSGYELVPELGKVDIDQLNLYVYPNELLIKKWGERLGDKISPRIGFFISNKSPARKLSWDKWSELIGKLGNDTEIIIFHAPNDRPAQEQLSGKRARCVSTDTVADLVSVMSYLDIVVSADSAPVHLASALKIPVVALFESRPEKYLRWYPIGVDNILLHEGKIVDDISVASIERAIVTLLNKSQQ